MEQYIRIRQAIKGKLPTSFLLVLGILLLLTASFLLGRMSVTTNLDRQPANVVNSADQSDVSRDVSTQSPSESESTFEQGGYYVGSVNGTKYHYPWCGSASRIKEENLVVFATIKEARGAGYSPAANCPGLE